MDVRDIRAFSQSFLDSQAFPYMFGKAFRPVVHRWAERLLREPDLPEHERRGIVIAMQELYEGFVEAYRHCDLEVPEWLDKEFLRGLIPE